MLKDFFEDRKRHLSDAEENNRMSQILPIGGRGFVQAKASEIKVG